MNHFLLPPTERLRHWHELKMQLNKNMSDLEQISHIMEWWKPCPLLSKVIDPYDTNTWPNAWELIYYGDFCKSSVALGMADTFLLREGRWTKDRITLQLIDDAGKDIYLIVVIDKNYVLNYNHNIIDKLDSIEGVQFLQSYTFNETNWV